MNSHEKLVIEAADRFDNTTGFFVRSKIQITKKCSTSAVIFFTTELWCFTLAFLVQAILKYYKKLLSTQYFMWLPTKFICETMMA